MSFMELIRRNGESVRQKRSLQGIKRSKFYIEIVSGRECGRVGLEGLDAVMPHIVALRLVSTLKQPHKYGIV